MILVNNDTYYKYYIGKKSGEMIYNIVPKEYDVPTSGYTDPLDVSEIRERINPFGNITGLCNVYLGGGKPEAFIYLCVHGFREDSASILGFFHRRNQTFRWAWNSYGNEWPIEIPDDLTVDDIEPRLSQLFSQMYYDALS